MKKTLLLFILIPLIFSARASDTLTIRQVYNFEVGDTLDYEVTFDITIPGVAHSGGSYMRYLITDKHISSASDTIAYVRQMLYPSNQTDTLIYTSLDSSIIYIDTLPTWIGGHSFWTGRDSNNLIVNQFSVGITDYGTNRTYVEGQGKTYSRVGTGNLFDGGTEYDTSLIYIARGPAIKGTPYYNQYRYLHIGISDLPSPASIHLYPAPTTGILHLTFSETSQYNTHLALTNLLGQQVYFSPISENETIHDISKLPSGIYTWRLVSGNVILEMGKVVKQ